MGHTKLLNHVYNVSSGIYIYVYVCVYMSVYMYIYKQHTLVYDTYVHCSTVTHEGRTLEASVISVKVTATVYVNL